MTSPRATAGHLRSFTVLSACVECRTSDVVSGVHVRPQGGPVGAMTAAGMEAEYGGRLVPIGHMNERMVLQGKFT